MKSFLIVSSLFLSVSAFAIPRVGDTATYTGTSTASGTQAPTSVKLTLNSIDTSDPQNIMYNVSTEVTIGTQVDTNTDNVNAGEFITEEMGAMIVTNCVAGGGTLETITTVPTGAISSCKIIDGSSSIWIGDIPFGYLKLTEAGGSGMDVILTSYARGP